MAQVLMMAAEALPSCLRLPSQVSPSNGGQLTIDGDGTCAYTSSSPAGGATVYRMSHTGGVACDVTDPQGNHFQVTSGMEASGRGASPVCRY